jgi:hypothetical protein
MKRMHHYQFSTASPHFFMLQDSDKKATKKTDWT